MHKNNKNRGKFKLLKWNLKIKGQKYKCKEKDTLQ